MSHKKLTKRLKKSDYRPLLSDVLPYETPYIFSNHFYFAIADEDRLNNYDPVTKALFGISDAKQVRSTIPYNYLAHSSGSKTRLLSVVHPLAQLKLCVFYSEYFSMMIDRASISGTSLRHPTAVSSRFSSLVYRDVGQLNNSEAPDDDITASNYFVTEPFNRLFKFYESREFLQLESAFPHCTTFDLSKCFYNIYTHSIAWAVKGRHYAKSAKSARSFENTFDSLMQFSNFGETNGIVVGPEFSRIFAEIILQRIDTLAYLELNKRELIESEDYVCRRYVDDYFIFAQSEDTARQVQHVYESLLEKYKLYVNENKITRSGRPISTAISSGKHEVFDLIEKFFSDYQTIFASPKNFYKDELPFTYTTREFFGRFQAILKKNGLSYADLSTLFLGVLRYRLHLLSTSYAESANRIDRVQDFIRFQISILQLTFYVISMDCRQRLVDIGAQVLLILREFSSAQSPTSARVLDENIQVEFSKAFLSRGALSLANRAPLEFCSLLIVVKNVCHHWHIGQDILSKFWRTCVSKTQPLNETTPFAYFEAMSLLFFFKDESRYDALREEIVESFISAVKTTVCQQYSCLTMAAVDLMACPHLSESQKSRVAFATTTAVLGETKKSKARSAEFKSRASLHSWFIDWEEEISVNRALFEKELRAAYR